ncbi:MAG: neutral zinc metallopeptidase, partial [Gaiellaceae bacterium]
MKWRRVGSKGQVEDRRGQRSGGGFRMPRGRRGGGGMPMPRGKAGGALGGGGIIAIIIGILAATGVFGGGGSAAFDVPGIEPLPPAAQAQGDELAPQAQQAGDDTAEFIRFVVQDVQEEWTRLFQEAGATYQVTRLVLFDAPLQTGCGPGSPATGPFYCPADQLVYVDPGFFQELSRRFGAPGTGGPGEFAPAYVIAHEFGHHIQNINGINDAVRREQRASPDQANQLSIRLELQA